MKLQAPTRLFAYDQPGQRICRLCFGSPISQRQVQHHDYVETIHDFLPTQRFGVVWWNRRSDGCQHRVLAVLEALETAKIGVLVIALWSLYKPRWRPVRVCRGPVFIGFAAHAEVQFAAGKNIRIGKPRAG